MSTDKSTKEKEQSSLAKRLGELYVKFEMPLAALSAAIYFALIFVVFYGKSHLVYAGFPAVIPWMIILIFAFMTYRRGMKFYLMLSERLARPQDGSGSKKAHAEKKYDDVFAEDEKEGGYFSDYLR